MCSEITHGRDQGTRWVPGTEPGLTRCRPAMPVKVSLFGGHKPSPVLTSHPLLHKVASLIFRQKPPMMSQKNFGVFSSESQPESPVWCHLPSVPRRTFLDVTVRDVGTARVWGEYQIPTDQFIPLQIGKLRQHEGCDMSKLSWEMGKSPLSLHPPFLLLTFRIGKGRVCL